MATIDRDSNATENLHNASEAAAEAFDRIGTAAVGIPDETDNFDDNDSSLKWILPLLIVVVMLILGYLFCSGKPPTGH